MGKAILFAFVAFVIFHSERCQAQDGDQKTTYSEIMKLGVGGEGDVNHAVEAAIKKKIVPKEDRDNFAEDLKGKTSTYEILHYAYIAKAHLADGFESNSAVEDGPFLSTGAYFDKLVERRKAIGRGIDPSVIEKAYRRVTGPMGGPELETLKLLVKVNDDIDNVADAKVFTRNKAIEDLNEEFSDIHLVSQSVLWNVAKKELFFVAIQVENPKAFYDKDETEEDNQLNSGFRFALAIQKFRYVKSLLEKAEATE